MILVISHKSGNRVILDKNRAGGSGQNGNDADQQEEPKWETETMSDKERPQIG
jgi:hypothetical protein